MAARRTAALGLCALVAAGAPFHSPASDEVLDVFLGQWRVSVNQLQPEPQQLSYTETYRRELDGAYIRGETSRKPDGSRDIVFGTYDKVADGYPFWIFSSTGSYSYLAPATWDARRKVMSWKNPAQFDISYRSWCDFSNPDLRSCYMMVKDWKGKVLSEMEWTAARIGE